MSSRNVFRRVNSPPAATFSFYIQIPTKKMKMSPFSVTLVVLLVALSFPLSTDCLGSSSTVAVSYGSVSGSSDTVCGIIASISIQFIQCYQNGTVFSLQPNASFKVISGGMNIVCGLNSDGFKLFCWDTSSFRYKIIYDNSSVRLRDFAVGDEHLCAIADNSGFVQCWTGIGTTFPSPQTNEPFRSITSGRGFSCGIMGINGTVQCWGSNLTISTEIQSRFKNNSMSTLVAGDSHACGFDIYGIIICRGRNNFGQLNVGPAFEFTGMALGLSYACAIQALDHSVVCWGSSPINATGLEFIVAGKEVTCGFKILNFHVICWGSGFSTEMDIPFHELILPGPCIEDRCRCRKFPNTEEACSGSKHICTRCHYPPPPSPPPPPKMAAAPPSSIRRNKRLLAFIIIGSICGFFGLCALIYCGIRFYKHQKMQLTTVNDNGNSDGAGVLSTSNPPLAYSTEQNFRVLKRQRSGTSTMQADRAREFTLQELAAATEHFSLENKIGTGSFGTVYKGNLVDGCKVAIKRGETGPNAKKFQEEDAAFESEITFLSRLHHKNLVKLVGFCQEEDEKLLVYEYMENGTLHNHLHSKNVDESCILNSWKMRIKISLDIARGIDYIHNFAVPPVIHRDIKTSNILLDANWTAKVSDFGLSLLKPNFSCNYMHTKIVGTFGYMDPYCSGVLTAKSDVYGFGVVLLELLTGKKAIFEDEEDEGEPLSVVDYALVKIQVGGFKEVLDMRLGMTENEVNVLELVAYTAMCCISIEVKERPTMNEVVINLEKALSLCDDSPNCSSSEEISIVSE